MLDLAFEPINNAHKKCGCYVVSPQILQLHPQKSILVPLKSCDYQMEIVNAMVNVTLVQTYQNPTEKFLELEYSFPISPNACVYRFIAEFGGNRIEGVVKEKEEAKREYNTAIKEGRKAAYGELNAESKDILNLKVGNIAPQQEVKIEVVYLQELSLSYNTFYQLHLPATITPRYLNHIPQEQVLAGFRKSSVKTEGTFNWSFTISLRTTRKVTFYGSHTHNLQLVSQNDTSTESIITLVQACIPNKDFVFSYTTQHYELPNHVFGRTDISSTAMLSFIPKFCTLAIDDAYKASVEGKNFEGDIDTARGEYIFLLDRSGSMGGARMEKAKQALIIFIKSLPQDTYFNVVSFGSSSQLLFESSRRYGNKDIEQSVKQIQKMNADMGGTQILQPLRNLLQEKPKDGYPKQIFLLTDGGVSDTEGVLRMINNNNKYARVHTIGIGNGCSESLIVEGAKRGKGCHVFINDSEDPSDKIIQLLTDSLSPVISNIKLDFDHNLVESVIPNPSSIPYYLKGQIINFYITFKGQLEKKTNFTFSYEDSQNKLPYSSKIEIDPESTNESFIDRMGHFKRIRLLEESNSNNSNLEDCMFYVKKVDKKKEIIELSVKHQILSEFTAFICVQKQLVDGQYQQINDKGKVQVFIESPPPIQYQERAQRMCYMASAPVQRSAPRMKMQERAMAMPQRQMLKCAMPMQRQQMMMDMCLDLKMESRSIKSSLKKEPQAPGFLNSVSSFFKGIFTKQETKQKESSKPQQVPNLASQPIIQQKMCSMEMEEEEDECNDILEEIEQCSIKRKSMKKQEIKGGRESKNIDQNIMKKIVAEQDSEGFWKKLSLIEELFSSDVLNLIKSHQNPLAAAAYLIAKWIEKNFPQKQYTLIVKKAYGYARKDADFQNFPANYDQYVQ